MDQTQAAQGVQTDMAECASTARIQSKKEKPSPLYTQLAINKLKEIHTMTHPARLTREKSVDQTTPDASAQEESGMLEDMLLAALDAEAAEEEE